MCAVFLLEGMDVSKVYVLVRYETSFIHAPARGATGFDCKQVFRCRVSIHAPARGATSYPLPLASLSVRFQSTHLQEVRRNIPGHLLRLEYVSIHAPTRGATYSEGWKIGTITVSIHAPTRGATISSTEQFYYFTCFNPRTYKRCDTSQQFYRAKLSGFNPRTYKRCDRVT